MVVASRENRVEVGCCLGTSPLPMHLDSLQHRYVSQCTLVGGKWHLGWKLAASSTVIPAAEVNVVIGTGQYAGTPA